MHALDARLTQLQEAQLVRPVPEEDRAFIFKHALTQDTAYYSLLVKTRREIHLLVAQAYEQLYAGGLDENAALLAQHFELAEAWPKALEYLVRAAERARRSAAHSEELALLARAIVIAERQGRMDLAAGLHARRGKGLASVTRWADARQELESALALLPPDQIDRRAEILVDLAIAAQWLGENELVRPFAQEALRLAEQAGRDDITADAMSALAMWEAIEGQIASSLRDFDLAIARAGNRPSPSLLQGMEMSGLGLYWLGQYPAAVERNREAVRLARDAHLSETIMRGLANEAMALVGCGRYDEALQTFQEARTFGRTHGLGAWLARTIAIEGGLHLDLYDYAGSEALALEAQELARAFKFIVAIASPGIDLLLNFARTGRLSRAESVEAQVTRSLPAVTGPHVWLLALRLTQARAELALARGRWEEALSIAGSALDQSRKTGRVKYVVAGLETRAGALAALGRKAEALSDLRTALELARPVGDPAMLLRPMLALLSMAGDDELAGQARRVARRISNSLPDEGLRRRFDAVISERV